MNTIELTGKIELLQAINLILLKPEGGSESYRFKHMKLLGEYAKIINDRNHFGFEPEKLEYIAMAHDLMKDQTLMSNASRLDPGQNIEAAGYTFPNSTGMYVLSNKDILERYNLLGYQDTDVQSHALAAGIFLHKELGEEDPDILYSVFFHSCPVMSIYLHLSESQQALVDTVMLADKLSSSYLRINMKHIPVRLDLDLAVFGSSGNEFNYSLGLVLARLSAQGKHPDIVSVESTRYYYNRLRNTNPLISDKCTAKTLGGKRKWPERKSMVLPTLLTNLNP